VIQDSRRGRPLIGPPQMWLLVFLIPLAGNPKPIDERVIHFGKGV
jgi:hypothetical protein